MQVFFFFFSTNSPILAQILTSCPFITQSGFKGQDQNINLWHSRDVDILHLLLEFSVKDDKKTHVVENGLCNCCLKVGTASLKYTVAS